MPRLGVITDELDADLGIALGLARELGLAEVELRMLDGRNIMAVEAAEVGAAVRQARDAGFAVSALAGPVFKCALDGGPAPVTAALHGGSATATLAEHWPLLDAALDLAATLEIPLVRVFSGWRVPRPEEVFDEVVALMGEAQRRAAGRGVEVVLENEHDCNVATAAETRALLDRVPGLRVIWDPANHVRAGGPRDESALDGYTARIAHMHLKDVDENGRWVPLGSGLVPYERVVEQALDGGYDGVFSLETHCELEGSRVAASAAAVVKLRPLVEGHA